MKKLEIIIKPEKLEDLKGILDSCGAHGLMISNIMGTARRRATHKCTAVPNIRSIFSLK